MVSKETLTFDGVILILITIVFNIKWHHCYVELKEMEFLPNISLSNSKLYTLGEHQNHLIKAQFTHFS